MLSNSLCTCGAIRSRGLINYPHIMETQPSASRPPSAPAVAQAVNFLSLLVDLSICVHQDGLGVIRRLSDDASCPKLNILRLGWEWNDGDVIFDEGMIALRGQLATLAHQRPDPKPYGLDMSQYGEDMTVFLRMDRTGI